MLNSRRILAMDNPIQEEDRYHDIRQTIRNIMVPLAQSIVDKKPEDIILFCSDYFNDLVKRRYENAENKNTENITIVRDCIQKKKEPIEQEYNNEESKNIEICTTNVQGSASDPVLTRDKPSHLRGTSSWDTPSNLPETRSRADLGCNLTDAVRGIGDQLQKRASQIGGLEVDIKADGTNSSMKGDSAFEDNISENIVSRYDESDSKVEGDVKVFYSHKKDSEESIKILGTEFEGKKTFQISEPLNLEDSKSKDCDLETNQSEGIKICRKQLSPNSSFGFIPHLDDSEEEMRNINSRDSENAGLITQSEEIRELAKKISETFHTLASELNSAETNFNAKLQDAKEISDVIEERDITRKMKLDMESDQNLEKGNNFIGEEKNEMFYDANNPNMSDLESTKDYEINDSIGVKIDPSFTLKTTTNMMPRLFCQNEKLKLDQEVKRISPKQMNYQQETFSHKETSEKFFDDDDVNDDDKSIHTESQVVVDKSLRRRWHELHPPSDCASSISKANARMHQANFSDCRHSVSEVEDVSSETDFVTSSSFHKECDNLTKLTADEMKSDTDKTSEEKLCERKASNEKIASAYPHNIPYSWRKLFKQSCSSESSTNFNKEPLNTLIDKRVNFVDCTKEENVPLYNERHVSEIDVTESEVNNFETFPTFQNEKEMSERKVGSNGYGDHSEEDISIGFKSGQNLSIQGERSSKKNKSTSTNDKNHSEKYPKDQEGCTCDQNTIVKNEKAENWKQTTNESEMADEPENFYLDSDSTVSHVDKTMKGEVGLNAACGDFVSANPNVRSSNTQTSAEDTKGNNEKDEGISAEYVGEVIERVMENQLQDSLDSSYEGLNFSCYSESDSSYCESSDLSETDDAIVDDSFEA